jgi:hypothetical protein
MAKREPSLEWQGDEIVCLWEGKTAATVAVGHGNGRAEALYDLWTTLSRGQAPALYLELVSRRYRVLTGREIETVR